MKRIIIKSSYLGALKRFCLEYHYFLTVQLDSPYKEFMFCLRKRFIPGKKPFAFFSSLFTLRFGAVVINDWKTIFYIIFVLKIL